MSDSEKMTRLTIRVPKDMKQDLERIAEEPGSLYSDMSDVGRDAFREFITDHDANSRGRRARMDGGEER